MIRVMVVDDQHLVRQGICSLLQLSTEIEVVAEACNGQEALDKLQSIPIDVMLLDLRMPVCDGLTTLQALDARGLTTRVLILTTFDDDELVLSSIQAGARGYLLKDVTLAALVRAIEMVHNGERLHQRVTTRDDRLADVTPINNAGKTTLTELTQREREVLQLLSGGYSNKEIARALELAEGTVKNHVSVILSKLGTRDRTRAVLKAIEWRLI